MGSKFKRNLKGQRFEMLEVVDFSHTKNGYEYWVCKCDCGKQKIVLANNLVYEKTKSCGCLQKRRVSQTNRTHGQSQTRLYGIWKGMRNRCYNPNARSYEDYGARGIQICSEWHDFDVFQDWALSNGYAEDLTIERKDCDGMYEPSNCEWISSSAQKKNTRRIHYIEHDGKVMSLADWSKHLGGGPNLVTNRLQRGWSEKDAVTIPVKKR